MMYRINVMTRSRSRSVYECVASNKIGEGRNISTVTAICEFDSHFTTKSMKKFK